MKTKVYSLYDTKSLIYGVPFFAVQDGVAVRMLTELVNDGRSNVSKFAEDYILYGVGVFDDSTGGFVSFDNPVNLGHASAFVKQVLAEVK